MRIFISGGCKNGKSLYAQRLAQAQAGGGRLYYVATMRPTGREDDERIRRHVREREGWGFETVEAATDIERLPEACDPGGSFLLDSVTALVANEMFPPGGAVRADAAGKVARGLEALLRRVKNIVLVSDCIYADAQEYDGLTEAYRRALARVDRVCAGLCEAVVEAAYGNMTIHKGGHRDDFDIWRGVSGET